MIASQLRAMIQSTKTKATEYFHPSLFQGEYFDIDPSCCKISIVVIRCQYVMFAFCFVLYVTLSYYHASMLLFLITMLACYSFLLPCYHVTLSYYHASFVVIVFNGSHIGLYLRSV